MEKSFALFKLGIKYLYRCRRRYVFLLAALVFCFAVVTVISSVKDGMYDAVYYSAQSHYAGDIVALGYSSESGVRFLGETEAAAILDASRISGINPRHTVIRTLYVGSIVHYNGAAIKLKYLFGCDWDSEAHILDRMNFTEAPEASFGDDGIIISTPSAMQLGAKMGDRVLVELETKWGQKNTGYFIVKGIVQDSSIFGFYKAYVSRLTLNRLLLYSDGDCSSVGFFFDDPQTAEQKRVVLQKTLSEQALTAPLVYDRDDLKRETSRSWEGIKIFLLTLPVYLSEISDLLDAMNILAYFLYAMMLLIILVSAVVTYRLILHERTKEMGVMRTIGFFGGDLRFVLWTEITILGFISLVAGFFLALLFTKALSFLPFSWFPSFEIFMKNGRLSALFLPSSMLLNVVSIVIILFASTIFPMFRASKKNLPGLLSGEPL